MVNLQSTQPGRSSYLKAKVVLEIEDAKLAEQVKPLMPRVMDAFQTLPARSAAERSRRLRRSLPDAAKS